MEDLIKIKVQKCTEGIIFSYKMIDEIYNGLYTKCCDINSDTKNMYSALNMCWSFIDQLHRIRELIQQFPTISQNDFKVKTFIENTKLTEEYRDYIQHLRGELTKNNIDLYPVWGSLSWVDKNDNSVSYVIINSCIPKDIPYSGCVYDTYAKEWVSNVSLGLGDNSYHFDLMYKNLKDFINFFGQKLTDMQVEISETAIKPQIISCKITEA